MKNSLLFIYYFLSSKIRKSLFEISPELYKRFFLKLRWNEVRKKFKFFKQFSSFSSTPVLNKKIFLENFSQLNVFGLDYEHCLKRGLIQEETRSFKPEAAGYTIGLSSGTSGKRGVFLTTDREQIKWSANLFIHLTWFSFFKKYKIAFFLRANSPLYEKVSRSKRISFKFFDLTHQLEKLRHDVLQFNPTVLVAPPYILNELLKIRGENSSALKDVNIIVSVADVLDQDLELKLKETFKCPIHQIYQATEGFLAATCRLEKLHLNEDLLYFEEEIIDKKTFRGSPILTDYFRESQAIVRYKLDDILVFDPEPCECGSKMRSLKRIEGRSDEILDFAGVKIFPDYIRQCIQNNLQESIDFCIVKENNQIIVKLGCESNQSLEVSILKDLNAFFQTFINVKPALKCEFNFQRDLTAKRKRVYNVFTGL